MTTPSSISAFIAHARSKGMDHQTIRQLLLSNGWKEKDIAEAMASGSLDMAVPLPPDAGSARDAFFHLLSFTSLITMISSLIIVFFLILNHLFPDAAFNEMYVFSSDGIAASLRWPIASLIVSFPLYIWMMRLLHKEYKKHSEKLGSPVRRWLTYLTLFFAACTLIGDAITLIGTFLDGDITIRFILKVITILILSGVPFLYYLKTLRLDHDQYAASPMHKQFQWVAVVIVGVALVWSFILMGSPMTNRAKRFDDVRLSDFQGIVSEINNYTMQGAYNEPTKKPTMSHPLPKDLSDVVNVSMYQKLNIVDPETGDLYEYKVLGESKYQLCANFTFARDLSYDIAWNHTAGHACFVRDVLDPTVH